MPLNSMKVAGAAVWVSVLCIAGIASDLTSLSGWILFAGLVVLPPVVMMWRWTPPVETLSEIIHEARR